MPVVAPSDPLAWAGEPFWPGSPVTQFFAVALTMPGLVLAAATEDPIALLIQGGPFAIILVLIITGKLASGQQVKDANTRAEGCQARLDAQTKQVMEDLVPALTRVTDATVRATDALMGGGRGGR